MGYGNEIILGYPCPTYKQVLEKALGIVLPDLTEKDTHLEDSEGVQEALLGWDLIDFDGSDRVQSAIDADIALMKAHKDACLEMGFWLVTGKPAIENYLIVSTPFGERTMCPFALEMVYDPDEMGDNRHSAIFGVPISGRYFPTFADWSDDSGGMTNILCDPEQKEWVIAKKHIVLALPWMKDAKFYVKEKHY